MKEGLRNVLDSPLRGYAEALGSWSPRNGPSVSGEVGVKPAPGWAVFARGQYSPLLGPVLGAGVRVEW